MSKEKQMIEVITYEQDRLNYFTDLMKKAQKRYNRLFKKYKKAPYMSAELQAVSDAGRETHFYGDVVEMLEKGYRKQEWISVEERLPEKDIEVLVALKIGDRVSVDTDRIYFGKWLNYGKFGCACEKGYVTHWMPLPEAPKMKGGAE